MTKTERIKQWISDNAHRSFTSGNQAMRQFMLETGENCYYSQFGTVYNSQQSVETTDENGQLVTTRVVPAKIERVREVRKMVNIAEINSKYSDEILTPMLSDSILDQFFSVYGGILPATLTVVPGESGVGKTTVILDFLGRIKKLNPDKRILFVSSEMNEIHMYKYAKRVNITGVDIVFLGQYERPDQVLEDTVREGWDIVFLDSMQDTIDKIKDCSGFTNGGAETFLLSLMDKSRIPNDDGTFNNDLNKYTAWIATQHMTKGNVYAGSTRLKHMTDAMLIMSHGENGGETFMAFSKNRDGQIRQRLYYTLADNACVYDEQRYKNDLDNVASSKTVTAGIGEMTKEWNDFFEDDNSTKAYIVPKENAENVEQEVEENLLES